MADRMFDMGYSEGYRDGQNTGDARYREDAMRIEALNRACSFAENAVREGYADDVNGHAIVQDAEKFYAFLLGETGKKDREN